MNNKSIKGKERTINGKKDVRILNFSQNGLFSKLGNNNCQNLEPKNNLSTSICS